MTAPIPQIKGIALANDIMAGKLPVADYPIFTNQIPLANHSLINQ